MQFLFPGYWKENFLDEQIKKPDQYMGHKSVQLSPIQNHIKPSFKRMPSSVVTSLIPLRYCSRSNRDSCEVHPSKRKNRRQNSYFSQPPHSFHYHKDPYPLWLNLTENSWGSAVVVG